MKNDVVNIFPKMDAILGAQFFRTRTGELSELRALNKMLNNIWCLAMVVSNNDIWLWTDGKLQFFFI